MMPNFFICCKDCPDRYTACSDYCEKYKDAKRKREEYKAKEDEGREARLYTIDRYRDRADKKAKHQRDYRLRWK